MKILLINEVYGTLSTGRTAAQLKAYMEKQGHTCLAAYAYGKKGGDGEDGYYRIGSAAGRKLHALLSRISGLQGYYSTHGTKGLIRFIRLQKPDIVQLSNVHGSYLNFNLLLKFLASQDIPVVVILHDCWFYTGRCTHYTVNGCYQWRTGCKKCPNNRNTLPSWFFDRSSKMWKDKRERFTQLNRLAVIGVSDWITRQAECSFLKDAFLLKRIYNGIDLEVFKPMEAGDIRRNLGLLDKFVILSAASIWSDAKGLKGFLKLAALLRKEPAGKDCVILLIGNMPGDLTLEDNVKILPAVKNPTSLARLYNAGDVFVSLSKEESFGKTVAEAIACGTPAIAFATTALPELVGKNCGHLVADNTLRGIYRNILAVKAKGKAYYSSHCTAYARHHFSKETCGQEYLKVYEKLLAR